MFYSSFSTLAQVCKFSIRKQPEKKASNYVFLPNIQPKTIITIEMATKKSEGERKKLSKRKKITFFELLQSVLRCMLFGSKNLCHWKIFLESYNLRNSLGGKFSTEKNIFPRVLSQMESNFKKIKSRSK